MTRSNTATKESKSYKCGYCGEQISSERGYTGDYNIGNIYICHVCKKPTFFDARDNQTPGKINYIKIKSIDDNIEKLFIEANKCYSIAAYTSVVMCCRKLLMNISVSEGAEEGKKFIDYVNYLSDNNYIPPGGKDWVDSIRRLGNEANHKIEFRTKEDAERILIFTEMLLKFIYELPGIMQETKE